MGSFVIAEAGEAKTQCNIYARPDVIGRLVEFDGDHFVVDFIRLIIDMKEPARSTRKQNWRV